MKKQRGERPGNRKTPVYAYHGYLEDGAGRVKVSSYANSAAFAKSETADPIIVHYNPGAFATKATTEPLLESLVRRATEKDRALRVYVHWTPYERDAYAPSKRIGRFGRVLLDAAGYHASHDGAPQHVVGHSWSWSDSVKLVHILRNDKEMNFGGMIALTPNGHPPQPNKQSALSFPGAMAEEVRRVPRALRSLGGIAVGAALAGSMVGRFSYNFLSTIRAIRANFKADVTDKVAEIAERMGVSALLASHDKVAPPDVTEDRLQYAGVKDSDLIIMPNSSHLSAVTDYETTAFYMFDLIEQQHDRLMLERATGAGGGAVPTEPLAASW